jgi:molecular chaperone DnaK (HSP70)
VERIVGIDLGTTNSLVAYLDDDTPRVIVDAATGRAIVPSVVSFPAGGEHLVGDAVGRSPPPRPPRPSRR